MPLGRPELKFLEFVETLQKVIVSKGYERPQSTEWVREYYEALKSLTIEQFNYGAHQTVLAWKSTKMPPVGVLREHALKLPRRERQKWEKPAPARTPEEKRRDVLRGKLFLHMWEKEIEQLQLMAGAGAHKGKRPWTDEEIDAYMNRRVDEALKRMESKNTGTEAA